MFTRAFTAIIATLLVGCAVEEPDYITSEELAALEEEFEGELAEIQDDLDEAIQANEDLAEAVVTYCDDATQFSAGHTLFLSGLCDATEVWVTFYRREGTETGHEFFVYEELMAEAAAPGLWYVPTNQTHYFYVAGWMTWDGEQHCVQQDCLPSEVPR